MNILISSIGRRGYLARYFRDALDGDVRIIGTSNTKWTVGFHECDQCFLMPDIASEAYISTLLRVCEEQKVDAILSVFDHDIVALSQHLERFQDLNIKIFLPTAFTSEVCFDKMKTYQFLTENEIGALKTYDDLSEAKKALTQKEIQFPLMVKPKKGFGSADLFKANNLDELEVFFNYRPSMVIQEFAAGEEYSFDILHNLNSEVVKVYCKKKMAMRSGETDKAIMLKDKKLIDFGLKLGSLFDNKGPMDVDFFMTSEGEVKVLEINPRFGGGYPISHAAGANFPSAMIGMLKGEKYSFEYPDYNSSVVMMKDYDFRFTMPNSIIDER